MLGLAIILKSCFLGKCEKIFIGIKKELFIFFFNNDKGMYILVKFLTTDTRA